MDSFIAGVTIGVLFTVLLFVLPMLSTTKKLQNARISALIELDTYRQRLYEARDYLVADTPVVGNVCLWVLHKDSTIEQLRDDIRKHKFSTMGSYLKHRETLESKVRGNAE